MTNKIDLIGLFAQFPGILVTKLSLYMLYVMFIKNSESNYD